VSITSSCPSKTRSWGRCRAARLEPHPVDLRRRRSALGLGPVGRQPLDGAEVRVLALGRRAQEPRRPGAGGAVPGRRRLPPASPGASDGARQKPVAQDELDVGSSASPAQRPERRAG
jgi:hypothetical protein